MLICDVCGFSKLQNDNLRCPVCGSDNWDDEDTNIIKSISTDSSFVEAMVKLKETDIIEYELKMSQFRNQIQQQKVASENNIPKCPHCNSTNIKPLSTLNRGASIAMWGVFSKKINKSFECKSCGYTW